MQSITSWNTRLKVGNDIIDNQHKILFDLIRDLKIAIGAGASVRIKDVLLGVLVDYSFQHFRTEEEYFAKSPDYMKHCLEHYELIKNLNAFIIDFRNNRINENSITSDFLENWLMGHIEQFDQPYFSLETANRGLTNKSRQIDQFYSDPTDRRYYKRIPHNEVVDGKINTDCYNATHLKNGKATIINMSPGGLLLSCSAHHDINDLLIISCRIGSTFNMKEKVKVKTVDNKVCGVEFISPLPSTIDFFTTLYGAVHLNHAKLN